jgi:microcystin-dependent protein
MDFWGFDGVIGNRLTDFLEPTVLGAVFTSGMIIPFATANLPDGWLECNGAIINRAQYASLFDIIGTTFDNQQTPPPADQFTLPDLRGRTATYDSTLPFGTASGLTKVVLTAENLPQHTHNITQGGSGSYELGGGAFVSNGVRVYVPPNGASQTVRTQAPLLKPDGTVIPQPPQPVPILNPFIVANYIIKT